MTSKLIFQDLRKGRVLNKRERCLLASTEIAEVVFIQRIKKLYIAQRAC